MKSNDFAGEPHREENSTHLVEVGSLVRTAARVQYIYSIEKSVVLELDAYMLVILR